MHRRRVQSVTATGSTESHRVRLNLTLQVSRVDFASAAGGQAGGAEGADASGSGNVSAALHISGPVTSENQHVRLGAFHTLDIEANRDIRIEKTEGWDSVALSRVDESTVPGRGAEVAAIVCGEGVAAFCLLSEHMTVVPHRLTVPIPRKSGSSSQHDKALVKFYGALYDAFIRHIPYSQPSLRAIVIASPGWVRDAVYDFLISESTRRGEKALTRTLKDKCMRIHINSPHVHSLVEVLKSPQVSIASK